MKTSKINNSLWFLLIIFLVTYAYAGSLDTDWKQLFLHDAKGHIYRASSELNNSDPGLFGPYGAHNLFDKNGSTCWAEGTPGRGIGESVYMEIKENLKTIHLTNGYAKRKKLFYANNRIKKAKMSLFVGINIPGHATEIFTVYNAAQYPEEKIINLEDTIGPQHIQFPFDWNRLTRFKKDVFGDYVKEKDLFDIREKLDVKYIMNIEIVDIYKGSKFDDTCISDVWFSYKTESHTSIKSIYLNEKENTIYFDSEDGKRVILDKNKDSVFQILEESKDKEWLIVIKMPAEIGGSRVETEYVLYYVPLRKMVDKKLIGQNVAELYGFEEKNGSLFIDYLNSKTFNEGKMDLRNVLDKLLMER